jgi:glycosyltransferase involved in cell wall biosynthesis
LPADVRLRNHPAHPLPRGLRKALSGADIVHVHQMRSAPGRAGAVIASLGRQLSAVTDHGLGGGGWAGVLPRMFDAFLPVSRYSAATLLAPASRTRVIYGGADVDRFRPDHSVVREGVLFVGRISPHKGLDRLIEAMPEGAALTVAGAPVHDRLAPRGYDDHLRRLASGRDVRFTGPVEEDALPNLYSRARVFVLPSVHETSFGKRAAISELLGLSVLEAMASGTPVICSAVGGLPEVVSPEAGFLVEPGNVSELREHLSRLLGDRALAARMGARGREIVRERFTWARCAERCSESYVGLSDLAS